MDLPHSTRALSERALQNLYWIALAGHLGAGAIIIAEGRLEVAWYVFPLNFLLTLEDWYHSEKYYPEYPRHSRAILGTHLLYLMLSIAAPFIITLAVLGKTPLWAIGGIYGLLAAVDVFWCATYLIRGKVRPGGLSNEVKAKLAASIWGRDIIVIILQGLLAAAVMLGFFASADLVFGSALMAFVAVSLITGYSCHVVLVRLFR